MICRPQLEINNNNSPQDSPLRAQRYGCVESRKPVRAADGPSVKIAALPAGANACTPSDGMLKLRVLQRGAKRSTDVAHVHVPQDDPLAKTVLQADAVAMVERQRLKQQILSTATSDYRP